MTTTGTLAWITSSLCGTAVIFGWFTHNFPLWILLAATGWAASNIIWATQYTRHNDDHS